MARQGNELFREHGIVVCTTNTYPLSGTITGLTAGGLYLVMGPTRTSPLAGTTSYKFPMRSPDGSPYNISVLT